ncbi:mucin-binding protein [Lacticaseibacillus zhaodongensis]|uniref:mucin-binding protein n=1 Tax=Lacticaseibacillus zhaodongensis TaxID=2668065 RepID=UPI0018AFD051|nr:MucBP domain-containing protein [Lacticaseibacillus zhaodongensis]
MLGDYRKLSTHNQLRQEPEIKTRVKMFKGKGQWLTTLLVAVGAAVAVQGQATAHAATSSTSAANPETIKPAADEVVAAKTAAAVKLSTATKAADSTVNVEQVEAPIAAPADSASTEETETATPTPTVSQQNVVPADDNPEQQTDEAASGPTDKQSADTTEQAAQSEQAVPATSEVPSADTDATQKNEPATASNATTSDTATAEQKNDASAATPAGADASAATGDATEGEPQFKAVVDPVSASLIDTIDWTKTEGVDGGLQTPIIQESILNSDGKTYILAVNPANSGDGYPLFNNWVADASDPDTHYMYTYATGLTSQYYMRDPKLDLDDDEDTNSFVSLEHDPKANQLYYGTGSDGTKYVRQDLEDKADNLTITEIVNIDPSGAFNHTVFIKNNGSDPLENVKFGTELDTAFGSGLGSDDVNDGVPIISNGDGSAYLPNATSEKNPNLTIFVSPTGNDTLIAGAWGGTNLDIKLPKAAAGTANGAALNTPEMDEAAGVRKDTSVQYETPTVTVAPGETISYSYSEHLYLTPVETGTITVNYQDENQQELKPATTVGGAVGSPFSVTPDQEIIEGYKFLRTDGNVSTFTKDPQTVTLIFTTQPATQTATITYQDASDGNKTLGAIDTITGDAGSTATYSSAERIEDYEAQGYKLVSDGTKDGIVFDSDDAADQPFVVQLEHNIVDVTPDDPHEADPKSFSATATRVINYVNTSDPTKVPAPATKTQTVTLTRTGTEDLVTKTVTYSEWKSATAVAVPSPDVAGYTPDQTTVAADTFTTPDDEGKPSSTVTVTYTADEQTAVVSFVDQDNNPVAPSQTITGATDTAIDHGQVATNIQSAMANGYTLVKDGTIGATFDHVTDKNQSFIVTFVPVEKASVSTNLIPQGPGAKPLTPTEPKTITGKPGDPISATDYPDVPGYTPDDDQSKVVPNKPGDTVVSYTPDTQKAVVTFVDNDGNTVAPSQTITGLTDTAVDHSTINIQDAMNAGYTLAQDGTVGAKFDHKTDRDQAFSVTLVPIDQASLTTPLIPQGPAGEPLTPTEPKTVTGKPGAPISAGDYPDVPGYTPNENQNKVVPNEPGDTIITYTPDTQTATVKYVDKSGKQLIAAAQTITGATATVVDHDQIAPNIQKAIDQGFTVVSDETIGASFDSNTDQNQTFTVVFAPIEQASITTTLVPQGPDGKSLTPKDPKTVTGKPGDPISATDYPDVPGYTPAEKQDKVVPNQPGDTEIAYTPDTQKALVTFVDGAGNTVVPSQSITGQTDTPVDHSTINIQAAIDEGYTLVRDGTIGAKFDHNTADDQTFEVTLAPMEQLSVTTTLIPHDPDGKPLTPTTPKTVKGNPGDPIASTDYPDVPGYTPDENQDKVVPNEPADTVIRYTPNTQTATVSYVDEAGNKLITPDLTITGASDSAIAHGQITAYLQQAINEGYTLTTDGTVGATFDHDDDQPQKFTVVFSKIPATDTTTPDGDKGGGGTTTPENPSGGVTVPPTDDSSIENPGLPSTFGGTTPNAPTQSTTAIDEPTEETMDEPSLPSTFGGETTDDSTGAAADSTTTTATGNRLVAMSSANTQAAGKTVAKAANAHASATLPQTGDRHATGLVVLGATLMMLLGLADHRRKLER